jgi:hypothetical protein
MGSRIAYPFLKEQISKSNRTGAVRGSNLSDTSTKLGYETRSVDFINETA